MPCSPFRSAAPHSTASRARLRPSIPTLLLTFGSIIPEQMIDYVKQNYIFGDFRRNLSNSEIARIRSVSRTTVVGLRELYNATVADKGHPEAYEDLLQAKPKYKDREVDSPVLTAEIKALIDKELEQNAVKLATGLKKQQKRATNIHDALLRQGYEVSYRTVVRYIHNKTAQISASVQDCFIKQKYVPGELIRRLNIDYVFLADTA